MVYLRDFLFYLSVLVIPTEIRGHHVLVSNSDCVDCEVHAISRPELLFSERVKRSIPKGKLVGNEECEPVIEELCKDRVPADDLAALDCILTSDISKVNRISEACKNVIWAHSLDFLEDSSLRSGLQFSCRNELQSFSECLSPSNLPDTTSSSPVSPFLTCILDRKETVLIPKCKSFLQQVERVVLFDFSQVTGPLAKYCETDVKQLECHHNQVSWEGGTLACLQLKLDQVKDELCRSYVMKLSELQAEDIHLDRQLYKACAAEYSNLCMNEKDANVDPYSCLIHNRMDKSVSKKCADELSRRLGLMARDYKASKGLARACREDVRSNHCRRRRPHSADEAPDVRLAHILLCLEAAIRNGSSISTECRSRMVAHRRFLFEDYNTSPEVVSGCSSDVVKLCSSYEGAAVIHCLMDHAHSYHRKGHRISKNCLHALEMLAKEADVGENWTVDPVLKKSCRGAVEKHCSNAGDNGVMPCLMELLGEEKLAADCRTALLQIQYFVSREFALDPHLYHHCHKDADRLCAAEQLQLDKLTGGSAMVLPCLYRHAYHPLRDPKSIPSRACIEQIRRVMHERAVSVDLQPEVEGHCMDELAAYCQERTGRGEEMVCLQDNLEMLSADCKVAVSNYTELEAGHVEINPIILAECKDIINKFCKDELEGGFDKGGVMDCLVSHKNDPEVRSDGYRCRAAVEHFQLISLKSYHFSYKFKEACRPHVVRYCPKSKTKMDVVSCLSEKVRNETLSGQRPSISRECRQQLRAQLLQRRESINLDPSLKAVCLSDARSLCANVKPGDGQVLECLQSARHQLSSECHRAIFNVEREELTDNSVDYMLLTACSKPLKQYCPQVDLSKALECLKKHKVKAGFDKKCLSVVVLRMIEQSSDYRLNPSLHSGCRQDIVKFCSHVVATQPKDMELEGKVVKCLKVKFREHLLRKECEIQISSLVSEAALNYKMNPALAVACKFEVDTLCEDKKGEMGAVEECLRENLVDGRIEAHDCRVEVATYIRDSFGSSLDLDPLLQQACAADDTKFCSKEIENGNHVQCLQMVLAESKKSLQPMCRIMLLKRMKMFRSAALINGYPPETFGELYSQVSNSPSRKYFLLVALSCIGLFFILGLFCGRASRRNVVLKKR